MRLLRDERLLARTWIAWARVQHSLVNYNKHCVGHSSLLHDVSGVCSTPAFRRLVVLLLTGFYHCLLS